MLNHTPFLYTTELESLATLCFRALDGSNYEVRCAVARLLGTLVATTQLPVKNNPAPGIKKIYISLKQATIEAAIQLIKAIYYYHSI